MFVTRFVWYNVRVLTLGVVKLYVAYEQFIQYSIKIKQEPTYTLFK